MNIKFFDLRIKVLHFYKSSYPEDLGGIPKFIDSLCRNSSDYPIDNIVLCLNTKPKKEVSGAEDIRFSKQKKI